MGWRAKTTFMIKERGGTYLIGLKLAMFSLCCPASPIGIPPLTRINRLARRRPPVGGGSNGVVRYQSPFPVTRDPTIEFWAYASSFGLDQEGCVRSGETVDIMIWREVAMNIEMRTRIYHGRGRKKMGCRLGLTRVKMERMIIFGYDISTFLF